MDFALNNPQRLICHKPNQLFIWPASDAWHFQTPQEVGAVEYTDCTSAEG